MSTGSLAATGNSEMSSNEPIGSANDGDEVVGDSDVSIIPSDDEIEDEDVDGLPSMMRICLGLHRISSWMYLRPAHSNPVLLLVLLSEQTFQ